MIRSKRLPDSDNVKMILEWLYLSLLGSYLIFTTLTTTSLDYTLPNYWFEIIEACMIGLTLVKLGIEKTWSVGIIAAFGALIAFANVAKWYNGDRSIVVMFLFVVAAKNIKFKNILLIYLIVETEITALAVVTAKLGISTNYLRYNNGDVLQAFGICNTTDFAADILFIVLAYVFLRKNRITYLELALIFGASYIVFVNTAAKSNMICTVVLCLLVILCKVLDNASIAAADWKIMKLSPLIMPLLAGIIIGMAALYSSENGVLKAIDRVLNKRISLGNTGLQRYGVKVFGNMITERGYGSGMIGDLWGEYFFLDSSYVRILIIDGMLLLLAVLLIYVTISKKLLLRGDIIGLAVIAVVALACVEEHHLLELCYNPFALLLFARNESPKFMVGKR